MTDKEFHMEDIEKIWKFNWKSISSKRKPEDNLSPPGKKRKEKKSDGRHKRKSENDEGNPQKKQAAGDDNYSETLNYLKNISNIHNVDSRGVVDIVNRNL